MIGTAAGAYNYYNNGLKVPTLEELVPQAVVHAAGVTTAQPSVSSIYRIKSSVSSIYRICCLNNCKYSIYSLVYYNIS